LKITLGVVDAFMEDIICTGLELSLALLFAGREIVAVKFITEKTQDKIGHHERAGNPNNQFQKAYHSYFVIIYALFNALFLI